MYVRAGAYVDDIRIIEPDKTADSGLEAVSAFLQITGFEPESAKCHTPDTTVDILRARLAISPDGRRVEADEERIRDIAAKIAEFIITSAIASGAAAKLRGKLSPMRTLAYDRLGRGRTNELIRRQYGKFATNEFDAATKNSLFWWRRAIKNLPPRYKRFDKISRVCAYSDDSTRSQRTRRSSHSSERQGLVHFLALPHMGKRTRLICEGTHGSLYGDFHDYGAYARRRHPSQRRPGRERSRVQHDSLQESSPTQTGTTFAQAIWRTTARGHLH